MKHQCLGTVNEQVFKRSSNEQIPCKKQKQPFDLHNLNSNIQRKCHFLMEVSQESSRITWAVCLQMHGAFPITIVEHSHPDLRQTGAFFE